MVTRISHASGQGGSSLKNKKILITAGSTWAPVDSVRVISNVATGTTGTMLAERFSRLGARVTLVLGEAAPRYSSSSVRVIRFKFFNELACVLEEELKARRYDIVIHSAAVSDYVLADPFKGKINSGRKNLTLKLKPASKIINKIKKWQRALCLVMFKLESGISDALLIRRARVALGGCGADLAVANRLEPSYRAYVIDRDKVYCCARSKGRLSEGLVRVVAKYFDTSTTQKTRRPGEAD